MNSNIDVNIFSPTGPVGIVILLCGLIFSGLVLYVIYAVSTDKESIEDRKIRDRKKLIQIEKINRLFPNNNGQ